MKSKAFTLVELVIIVVIIGVLAAMMFPNMIGMQTKAKLREVENTVGVINAAIKIYYFKVGAYPETAWWTFAEAANGYVDSGGHSIENILNISIPKGSGAICQYRFNQGPMSITGHAGTYTNCVVFRDAASGQRQGIYSINMDLYAIEGGMMYERYLEYLE